MKEIIPIDKESIPYSFDIDLSGVACTFMIDYNMYGDFFTMNLSIDDQEVEVGAKLTLGVEIFNTRPNALNKVVKIVPLDITGKNTRITYENFSANVLLFVMDR